MQLIRDARKIKLEYPEAAPLIEQIEGLGFQWGYNPAGKLPDITTQRIQVRTEKQVAPPTEVHKYAQAYRLGNNLPPIVETRDRWVIDGATRTEGARKAGLTSIAMFIVEADWNDAPEPVQKRLIALGTALNNIHGRPMSAANNEALIMVAHQEGEPSKVLAARLKLKDSTVQAALAKKAGLERAAKLKVDLGDLQSSHIKLLGGKKNLNNLPWIKLAELAHYLTVSELGEVAAQIRDLSTDEEKLAVLQAEVDARPDQVKGYTSSSNRANRASRALDRMLEGEDEPSSIAQWETKAAERQLAKMIRARRLLDEAIPEQQKIIKTLAGVTEEASMRPPVPTPFGVPTRR